MKLGTYHYKYLVTAYPVRTFADYQLRVEVLAERRAAKSGRLSYLVKFLGWHADGRKQGATSWVRAGKVKLDEAEPKAPAVLNWLPYKDD